MTNFHAVVLGSGVAGMTAAHALSETDRVLVIDEFAQAGGNQRSYDIGPYTFDIGAFYFWDGMPFFNLFPAVGQSCVPVRMTIGRINPRGELHRYPFSPYEEVVRRGPGTWVPALASIVRARIPPRSLESAEDFARYYLGEFLYRDLGLDNYMARFYGAEASAVDLAFAESRMGLVRSGAALSTWVTRGLRSRKVSKPEPPARKVRPVKGFAAMYEPALEVLRSRGVEIRLGVKLDAVEVLEDGYVVRTSAGDFRTSKLVSTIPISRLFQALKDVQAPVELRSSDLMTLFMSFAGERGFRDSILYNFHARGRWKRITMHSDFYGPRAGREYFSVEVPQFGDARRRPIVEATDCLRTLRSCGLLHGTAKLEGFQYTTAAYPGLVYGQSDVAAGLLKQLADLGIIAVGRQGRFDYLPTGMHVVEQVRGFLGGA